MRAYTAEGKAAAFRIVSDTHRPVGTAADPAHGHSALMLRHWLAGFLREEPRAGPLSAPAGRTAALLRCSCPRLATQK